MVKSVLIEPHFLPSLEYFSIIAQAERVALFADGPFKKQTYRNRCQILGPNGISNLVIPVHYNSKTILKDVTIDYNQSWVKDHWGAVCASYGKAPFFEYFGADFESVWKSKPKYLIDLNIRMLSLCLKFLQWDRQIDSDHLETASIDFTDQIQAKKSFENREIFQPVTYQQNFGNTFVNNLSILDLLLCQGPESGKIIRNSIKTPIERFSS